MRGLIVTHGDLGLELIASSALVLRSSVQLEALSNRDTSADGLAAVVRDWLRDSDEPALIMVDDPAGSCGIACCRAAVEFRADGQECWVLGGVNLAMVVTFLARGAELSGDALIRKILERAQAAIRLLEPGS